MFPSQARPVRQVKSDFPGLSFTDVGRQLGKMCVRKLITPCRVHLKDQQCMYLRLAPLLKFCACGVGRWRELDAATKKEYEDRATAAKDAYLAEKRAWLEQHASQTASGATGAAFAAVPATALASIPAATPVVIASAFSVPEMMSPPLDSDSMPLHVPVPEDSQTESFSGVRS